MVGHLITVSGSVSVALKLDDHLTLVDHGTRMNDSFPESGGYTGWSQNELRFRRYILKKRSELRFRTNKLCLIAYLTPSLETGAVTSVFTYSVYRPNSVFFQTTSGFINGNSDNTAV